MAKRWAWDSTKSGITVDPIPGQVKLTFEFHDQRSYPRGQREIPFHLPPKVAMEIAVELVRAARYVDSAGVDYERSIKEAEAELDKWLEDSP